MKPTLDIVGAGLVGSLLAVYLRRRGHGVRVWERRGDPRAGGAQEGRSINLVITSRGLHGLDRVGLKEEALRLSVPVVGRLIHSLDGNLTFQRYGKDDSECNYSVSRGALNRLLVERAAAQGAEFRFSHRLTGGDAAAGRWEFDGPDGPVTHEATGPMLGTDGANSRLRELLVPREFRLDLLEYGYRELTIPPSRGATLDGRALHIWPRGAFMMMALPNRDRSFTVTLYLPYRGPVSFEAFPDPDGAEALFRQHFPDALDLVPDLRAEWERNPVGSLSTVWAERWHHGGRALLLGDAAHGIVPFFGQGMNCGFEDLVVLDEILETTAQWDKAFQEFFLRRKPNTDAIAEMALQNFIEMRDRVGDARFLLKKAVEAVLEREFPGRYRSRYSMITYSLVPYRLARDAGVIQEEILGELCQDIDRVEQLDRERAGRLIAERLTPFVEGNGMDLSY